MDVSRDGRVHVRSVGVKALKKHALLLSQKVLFCIYREMHLKTINHLPFQAERYEALKLALQSDVEWMKRGPPNKR